MYPTDIETRKQLTLMRAAHLTEAGRQRGESRGGTRQRFGFWLVEVGLRLACERQVLTQA